MNVAHRSEISPLCDIHRQPMDLFEYRGALFRVTAFSCKMSGCSRAYDSRTGYFNVVNGRIALQKNQRLCRQDNTPMFLESVLQNGIEVWRCGQIDCDGKVRCRP